MTGTIEMADGLFWTAAVVGALLAILLLIQAQMIVRLRNTIREREKTIRAYRELADEQSTQIIRVRQESRDSGPNRQPDKRTSGRLSDEGGLSQRHPAAAMIQRGTRRH